MQISIWFVSGYGLSDGGGGGGGGGGQGSAKPKVKWEVKDEEENKRIMDDLLRDDVIFILSSVDFETKILSVTIHSWFCFLKVIKNKLLQLIKFVQD